MNLGHRELKNSEVSISTFIRSFSVLSEDFLPLFLLFLVRAALERTWPRTSACVQKDWHSVGAQEKGPQSVTYLL